MRNFLKKITHPFLKIGLNIYYYKPRIYSYKESSVLVHPDVFPPHLTLSTKILLDFISQIKLKNKKLLELGCGSGIISIHAAKMEALVTASDINQTALEFLEKNSKRNQVQIEIVSSNLFDSLPNLDFDYIIINPPYYPKTPKDIKEKAWFCGENFDYFENLFEQIHSKKIKSKIYMILSEDCQIENILSIGKKHNCNFTIKNKITSLGELNFIFEIQLTS
jgi:release factor glutamine methyltransferase